MKAGGRHPMAGAEHSKHGRAGARPTPRRATRRGGAGTSRAGSVQTSRAEGDDVALCEEA